MLVMMRNVAYIIPTSQVSCVEVNCHNSPCIYTLRPTISSLTYETAIISKAIIVPLHDLELSSAPQNLRVDLDGSAVWRPDR